MSFRVASNCVFEQKSIYIYIHLMGIILTQRRCTHLFNVEGTEEAVHEFEQTTGKVAVQGCDDLLY